MLITFLFGPPADFQYYSCSKEFLDAGKRRLMVVATRQATSPEVKTLRIENR
jgi:transposase